MAKEIWRASVSFVDRHPSIFTATTIILILTVFLVSGVNMGYVKLINARATPHVHYSKVVDVTMQPSLFLMYGDTLRIGAGIEVGYIRPISISVMASLPMFQEIDKEDLAFGAGLDTQVLDNFFVGASYNKRFDGVDFWAVYGKLLFGN